MTFSTNISYICAIKGNNTKIMSKKIGIAADHAGYEMKEFLTGYLVSKGFEVFDYGCSSEESCDYADFAHPLAEAIEAGEFERGIGICGSGEGMAITLNKHQSIRASLCWIPEIAHITRMHNDSNVLVLPARFIDNEMALAILDQWLETEFDAGGRHSRRLTKIAIR
jgi:ribose 5-phosphate isomerase B